MKSEMSEVLNVIAMMGPKPSNGHVSVQSNSHPVPQGFSHQPASFPNSKG